MYNLIRFYNQNRKKIFKIIIIIVFIIVIIQLLNLIVKNKEITNQNSKEVANVSNNNDINNTLVSGKSAISGENINSKKLKSEVDIIDEFFNYCNNGKIDFAYNMLTDECKEEMFPTEEAFNENYYLKIFNNSVKTHLVESWINNIYKVEINDDFLSTGKVTKDNTIVDYITVVNVDNEDYKININNYIGRTYLNAKAEKDGVEINVLRQDSYMNYTTYVFEILNNTGRVVMLDDINNLDTMYLKDSNDMKYSAYTHEISQDELKLYDLEKKQIKIKFYSRYGSTKKIKSIVFSKLILDYENYETLQNKALYGGFCNFEIKL